MKQMAKTLISVALVVVFTVLSLSASAGIFHYDFDVLKENDWELWGQDSLWRVKEGFLRTIIQAPGFSMGLLQFKGIPGRYETFTFFADNRFIRRQVKKSGYKSFTITVKNLGAKRARFSVAIGRRFPDLPGDEPYFYLFSTRGIEARTYSWGGGNPVHHREQRHPDTLWDTGELASMKIHFDRGHFQWFADGKKRADFEDPDFSPVEIIWFMIQSNRLDVGSGWVDSFTISDSGLAVSPQAKLATTWGQLKQRR